MLEYQTEDVVFVDRCKLGQITLVYNYSTPPPLCSMFGRMIFMFNHMDESDDQSLICYHRYNVLTT